MRLSRRERRWRWRRRRGRRRVRQRTVRACVPDGSTAKQIGGLGAAHDANQAQKEMELVEMEEEMETEERHTKSLS